MLKLGSVLSLALFSRLSFLRSCKFYNFCVCVYKHIIGVLIMSQLGEYFGNVEILRVNFQSWTSACVFFCLSVSVLEFSVYRSSTSGLGPSCLILFHVIEDLLSLYLTLFRWLCNLYIEIQLSPVHLAWWNVSRLISGSQFWQSWGVCHSLSTEDHVIVKGDSFTFSSVDTFPSLFNCFECSFQYYVDRYVKRSPWLILMLINMWVFHYWLC